MKKTTFLYIAFGFFLLMGGLHLFAEIFYFYWALWWFDNVVHFVGGLSLGFSALYIFYNQIFLEGRISLLKALLIAFIFALILGSLWEVFEYVNGLTQSTEGYTLDTIHDLMADTGGSMIASLFAKQFLESF